MPATLTARAATRLGRLRARVVSPYTGNVREVVEARPAGSHVELVLADHRTMLVDPDRRLELVDRRTRRRP